MRTIFGGLALLVGMGACGSDSNSNGGADGGASSGTPGGPGGPGGTGAPIDGGPTVPPAASCSAAGGSTTVQTPTLLKTLKDDGQEGWMGSPAIVDLDNDGKPEIVATRESRVMAWHADGTRVLTFNTGSGRIWAGAIVGNFTGDAKLEIAVAARDSVYLIDAAGKAIDHFPQVWADEIRTIAAGDIDGDGALDLAVASRKKYSDTSMDIVSAYHANGTAVPGFPPVASGVAGCTPGPCNFANEYDQNMAIGDLDGDGKQDLVVPVDAAYASFFKGTGVIFDSNPMFKKRTKTAGVRYLLDYNLAKAGSPNDESVDLQAHFTNTPPAIADIDKDGKLDIVFVSSVQIASQDDRLRGVALWVVNPDASRHAGWEAPFYVSKYVMGLDDAFAPTWEGTPDPKAGNLVGLTNQVTIADIDGNKPGLEMIFAGYDGRIHAVAADKKELWSYAYAEDGRALTPGLVVADLSGDGSPEIAFTTYSPDAGHGALYILSAGGAELQKIALPGRGSMAAPTIGDADGNGTLDIVVSLKDESGTKDAVQIYQVPGSKPNCMLWPTGRANYLRNGWVR